MKETNYELNGQPTLKQQSDLGYNEKSNVPPAVMTTVGQPCFA